MLYYIDNKPEKIIKAFVPRVPKNRLLREDDTTKRICLSKTLEGCVKAASWGGTDRVKFNPYQLFKVYEFEEELVLSENLLCPENLSFMVPDSSETGEYWVINQSLVPSNVFYCVLSGKDDGYPTDGRKSLSTKHPIDFKIIPPEEIHFGKVFKVGKCNVSKTKETRAYVFKFIPYNQIAGPYGFYCKEELLKNDQLQFLFPLRTAIWRTGYLSLLKEQNLI